MPLQCLFGSASAPAALSSRCIKSQQGDDWLIIGIIPAEEAEEAPRMRGKAPPSLLRHAGFQAPGSVFCAVPLPRTGSYGIKSKETYTDVRHPVSCRQRGPPVSG